MTPPATPDVTRLTADHIIPMDGDDSIHSPGVVDVADGRVVWSGPAADAPPRPHVPEVRAGDVLLPGWVDIHCHTPMVLLRGAGENLPVDEWLRTVMWPRESKLTYDDVSAGMTMGGAELLSNGVTSSVEMYFFAEAVAEAAERAGLRCLVTPPLLENDQLERFGTWQHQLDEMVALADRWSGTDLIDVGIGPHAVYSTSDECLRAVAEVATAEDLLVHIHVEEGRWEDAAIRSRTGGSGAVEWLERLGVLDARVLAAHCVWLSDQDMALLAGHRAGVAHCPCSNAKHGSGIARVADMRAAGLRVGLGTDGPASHHRLDPFEEMRTALRVARASSLDPGALTPVDALAMATREAADAIGRPDLGRLTPGSAADMVSLSLDDPAFHPVVPDDDDLVSRIVWSGTPADIARVWVAGRPVATDGRCLTVDVEAARADVTERARRLAG